MDVKQIVKRLNKIFYDYAVIEQQARRKYNLTNKDIRFTYYRTSNHNIEATLHLLMMADTGLQNQNYLNDLYSKYSITNRFEVYKDAGRSTQDILVDITGQFIANGHFSSMYHLFENAFKIICQEYDLSKYDLQKSKFANIFGTFMKEFKTKTHLLNGINTDVYDYLQIVRNSIHNNGMFVSSEKTDRHNIRNFDGDILTIKHNQVIPVIDVWQDLFKMSGWFNEIFTGIISIPKIESASLILDQSQ